ncbi:hypothetical protein [uncultured Paludibaculum sp.]|uniref:hypothetical protein n=1 Tax=uncultured Paludibaculum sp. TaxID=1765020 RepID=UPI002AAB5464|nr:hypothetical protein [uncultured Paludibaculum sp.]
MSVNAINSTLSATSLESILKTRSTGTSEASGVTSDPQAKVSTLGNLMSQLNELQQSDQEQFKTTTSKIAEKLKEAAAEASESGDSEKATKLSELAQKFETASETGEMPDLRPPDGMKGPGGPPPGGPPPTDSSTSSTSSTEDDDSSTTDSTDSTDSTTSAVLAAYKEMMALLEKQAGTDPMSTLTDVLESVFSEQTA